MNIDNVIVGTILIPLDSCSLYVNMGSAIRCVSVNEQGFRLRRMNLYYQGEEFFLTRQALQNSNWTEAPNNTQLRFL